MTESDWANRYSEMLKKGGAVVFKIVGSEMQESGWPDRWICHRRWKGWLENKMGSRQATALQARKLKDLRERGEAAFVLRLIEDEIRFEVDTLVVYHTSRFNMMATWQDFLRHCEAATLAARDHIWRP